MKKSRISSLTSTDLKFIKSIKEPIDMKYKSKYPELLFTYQ